MANLSIAFLIFKEHCLSIAYPLRMPSAMGRQCIGNAIKEDQPDIFEMSVIDYTNLGVKLQKTLILYLRYYFSSINLYKEECLKENRCVSKRYAPV